MGISNGGGGTGGGSSPLHTLGPFAVNFNTPGVNSSRIDLVALAANTTVIRAWGIVTTAWVTDQGDGFQFTVEGGDAAGLTTSFIAVDYPTSDGTAQTFEYPGVTSAAPNARVCQVPNASGWKLRADVWVNGAGTLLSGVINFYALVYVPV